MSVILMLLLISVLIIAHEMGHFFVARWCGVRVERFGFGLPFGPTLWSRKVGDTEYCIHAMLFGGYVSFPDDNPESGIPKDSLERFENQPAANRLAIASAGVVVNAIMGWLIMFSSIVFWGNPVAVGDDIYINRVTSPTSIAAKAGVQAGDRVLAIGNKPIADVPVEKRIEFVKTTITSNAGKPLMLRLEGKDHKVRTLTVVPNPKDGTIGIQQQQGQVKYEPVKDWGAAASDTTRILSMFIVRNFEALGQMVSGKIGLEQLSSPIEIVKVGAEMIDTDGIQNGLKLTAVISVILAVMNLLPIPALDGGHILFILIEMLKGSPVRREIQERCVQFGFVGLLLLMSFVLLNDINKLWIAPLFSQ